MKKQIITRKEEQYYKFCPYCKKRINGRTENQVTYNLDIHIKAKHKKK